MREAQESVTVNGAEDLKVAGRNFNKLVSLPVEECERRIARSRTSFRGVLLTERLIAESDRYLPGNAKEAYRFAELTYTVTAAYD
jgi:hypothetical protein